MTVLPDTDELRTILRHLQEAHVLGALAIVADVSDGTLYRHARTPGAKGQPATMDGETKLKLTDTFDDLGLLDGYEPADIRRAARALKAEAAILEAEGALMASESANIDGSDGTPGESTGGG